jgi:hypothetical protein
MISRFMIFGFLFAAEPTADNRDLQGFAHALNAA